MIAAEDERVTGAAQHRLHAAPVRFDARGLRIVKAPAMNCAPEVRVQLEVGASPLAPHRLEYMREVFLRPGMRAVDGIPRAATPSAKRHLVRAQRRAVGVLHEP